MSSGATTLAAALIGSAPGWAGVFLALKASKRHTDLQTERLEGVATRQTAEIKAHVADALARTTPTGSGEVAP